MVNYFRIFCLLFLFIPCVSMAKQQLEAEVITWWVSGSERAALEKLISAYEAKGHKWIDTPVENSYHAKTTAISRILNETSPAAVQWQAGVSLQEVYKEGLFRDINEVAANQNWQEILPAAIWENITAEGNVIAVPMTLHGSNWLWANKTVLDKTGVKIPETWTEFIEAAAKIKAAGYIPLALGGQPWQERALFLPILLGVGGKDFYRATIIEHDIEALGSAQMADIFKIYGTLRQFIDPNSKDRNWSDTSKLVIDGKAAFQIMGDWVKGEFFQENKKVGKDFLCTLTPGSRGAYLIVTDAFAMGNVQDSQTRQGQIELAKTAMSKEVQRDFNLSKGSIPPRTDVSTEKFDTCATLAMATVSKEGNAYPGFNMANTGGVGNIIMEVITEFWNNPSMKPEEAARHLAAEISKVK